MVQKPRNSAGTSEIAGLLDLLNNSEADETSDTQLAAEAAPASLDAPEATSFPEITSKTEETVDLSTYPENSDNRFAAHIVFGLSKLKRS